MKSATKNISNISSSMRTGFAPRFSIITSTLNVASTLPLTARSLAEQTCRDFEWIVIDAASGDGTVEVARGFGDLVTVLVSEPDTGIYDAWNKALPLVRGRWVLFLGAGDTFYADDVLENVSIVLKGLPARNTTLYGNVAVVDVASGRDEKVRDQIFQGLEGPWSSARPLIPCHQGVFQRSSVFEGFRFDQRCRICADSETVLRELLAGRGVKLDLLVARFINDGISSMRKNRLRLVSESIYINWKLGIFHSRPFYQAAVLLINALLHPSRVYREWRG